MRFLLYTLLSVWVVSPTVAQAVRIIPADAFWEVGFPWLAGEGNSSLEPFEMPVYQLSCASCLESFGAILKGEEEPSSLFFLNTHKPEDREVAHAMIATVLAQPDEENQRRVFRKLLEAYLVAPELYLNDLSEWRRTCLKEWGGGAVSTNNSQTWADALNQLQAHNRLLGWLDVYQTPAWLSMGEESRRVLADEDLDDYQRQFRMLMVTEPSLQPNLGDGPVKVHQIRFDAGFKLDATGWTELVAQLEQGALWTWSEARATDSKWVKQWRAKMESLPNLKSRRDFFIATFRAVSVWKQKGHWSLLEFLKSSR